MFQPGDVVKLKSGGPLMTVRWCSEDSGEWTVLCDWFEVTTAKSQAFVMPQLQLAVLSPD
jgi:uncharacterized protein YodC (DUF2158 family)